MQHIPLIVCASFCEQLMPFELLIGLNNNFKTISQQYSKFLVVEVASLILVLIKIFLKFLIYLRTYWVEYNRGSLKVSSIIV